MTVRSKGAVELGICTWLYCGAVLVVDLSQVLLKGRFMLETLRGEGRILLKGQRNVSDVWEYFDLYVRYFICKIVILRKCSGRDTWPGIASILNCRELAYENREKSELMRRGYG